jgi:hypothetical protein
MQKNVTGQKLIVFAFDSTTSLPVSGDAANLTAYVSKDYGTVTVLGDTSATEMDATNAKGYYLFDLTQAETNANTLLFSAKSSTANIVVVAVPATVFTNPPNYQATSIDASGRLDLSRFAGQTITCGAGVTILASVGTAATSTAQTGDAFARIGSNGAGLTAIGDTRIANLDAAVSSRMATYTQPTGFLAATFPATVASTTNITAGTITTVSGNVNGSVGSVTGAVGSVTGAVGSVTGNVGGSVASVTAVVSANITKVNSVTLTGTGVSGDSWRPA